jgi:hypothetical protein
MNEQLSVVLAKVIMDNYQLRYRPDYKNHWGLNKKKILRGHVERTIKSALDDAGAI